jgi:hypothetical protein
MPDQVAFNACDERFANGWGTSFAGAVLPVQDVHLAVVERE